jgi:hypothetical protein
MPKELVNGVTNFYGPRGRSDTNGGQIGTKGAVKQFAIELAGDNLTIQRGLLPAGAVVIGQTVVEILEPFVLGGTSPVINVGVVGTEGVNRLVQLTAAQAQSAAGTTLSIAPAGTLAVNAPLAANATIGAALGGTSPTVTAAGRLKLVVQYKSI